MYSLDEVRNVDPEIAQAIVDEQNRQNSHIELIASENWVSKAVMAAMGSPLTNKYAEGYPGKRYYGGCECVDVVEEIARDRAKELFGCEYVNVQPHSGAQANLAVQFAVCEPGDVIMGMNLDHGGHLTHGSPVNISGKYFKIVPYGVNDEGFIDYEKLREIALEARPKMIIAGASAYARTIDFKRFREIADEAGAYLMVVVALMIPFLAAFTQWLNVKLMPQPDTKGKDGQENSMAASMKMMNTMMPIMSAVFCFTLPAGMGIYWVAGAVVRSVQQVLINKHIDKIDMDDVIQKNLEKREKKLEKMGISGKQINDNASINTKRMNSSNSLYSETEKEEKLRRAREYFETHREPGSIAAKANMVREYNEKNNKK